ncbi:alkaline phosphatase family protein [Loigolactobacillus coryniformis]|uniref:alkaline phosphatase family protein n=1 Tax=Loigolactobacillus coryniformis TaxID=1610 RepID=UPI001C5EE276|nr:alkaline phosphatase family protein [Loigolactobacillus coryniformis]MBW4802154.1 sulfatase-like hydrolase/transferase [Loigolactobacillus coryniformis subsp. torquens]
MINKNVKSISFIPLVASFLILMHYILVSAVTPPTNTGIGFRYLFYWLLVILSSTGTNILVLYLGYVAKLNRKPWEKIGRIASYFVAINIVGVIWGVIFFQSFAAKDLWQTFFPISSNQVPFAASLLIWYVLGPFVEITTKLNHNVQNSIILFLVWFVIVLPFLFVKPLWGITTADNFIWIGTLFIFGVFISNNNFNLILKYKFSILVICISTILIIFFLQYNPISNTQNANELSGRFFANYLLNVAFLSLAIFGMLLHFLTKHWNRMFNKSWYNWFVLITYFVTSLPIVSYRLGQSLHIDQNLDIANWLKTVVLYTVVLVISIGTITYILDELYKIKALKIIIDKITIHNFSDFIYAPQFIFRILSENWHLLLVIFCGFIFTIVQMVCVATVNDAFSLMMIRNILITCTNPIILNIIIFSCFFTLLFSITNRFWPSLFFTGGASLLIAVAEFLKLNLRDEPILPADLSMVTAITDILNMINPVIIISATITIILFAIISILLEKNLRNFNPHRSWRRRAITVLAMLLFFSGSFFVNHKNSLPYIVFKAFDVKTFFFDQPYGALYNGPIIQFINNLDVTIMDQPTGYSKVKIQSIMAKYDRQAKDINKMRENNLDNQTFIFILSESFSDPNRVPQMSVSPNPIPYLTSLKQQTNSGLMISSGYGGGTANMEWQSLTGLSLSNLSSTLLTPYTQLVPQQNIAPAFTDLFDSTVAIHPFNASLYNRKQVFQKFGFQRFYYQGSKNKLSYQDRLGTSPYVSDSSAYHETLRLINKNQSNSQFIQISTMQNHMPYTNYYKDKKFKISGSAFDSANTDSVQTYIQGVNHTDKALKEFIKKLNKINKPITVVWYGDHLASLYKSSLMDKYPIQLHETDYFVYNNQKSKNVYSNRIVSPYSFPALALDTSNSKVTPFYALITRVADNLPAMTINPATTEANSTNGSNVFVGQNSEIIKYSALSKQQKKLYHDYQLIQYDLVAGNQYSAKWAEQKISDK